jgi:SPP1 gp7 family putative phage head morphogenesis protein
LSEAVAETAGKSSVTLPNIDKAITSILNTPMQVAAKGGSVYLNTLLNSFAKQEAKRTRDRITAGYFNNETVSEIARSISGTRRNNYKDGLLNITNSNARTMAKTGVTHLQTQASHTVFKENEDIIKGYEIVATLDSKTSGKCRSLDGQIFYLGNGPKPPFHPNCRTTTTAVLKDEYNIPSAKADRLSQTGDVSSETTYYSWLKNQPADIQNQALGTERGLIFRNSGLSPEEFRKASVDQFYEPLTIDQMAAKDKRIANYMRN